MKLAQWLAACSIHTDSDIKINDLQNDSRQLKRGDAFIAYRGDSSDGRNYIDKAIASGAAAVLYDPEGDFHYQRSTDIPLIAITDLKSKLGRLAKAFYFPEGQSTIEITAVTGTNGKTSIAFQLAQAHRLLGKKSAYIGTIGQGQDQSLKAISNTTPDPLLLQKLLAEYQAQGVEQLAMEVSSHALTQGRVDELSFKQAVFTNLSHEHLDYHGTMEAYASAKAKLFGWKGLKTAVLNADDQYSEWMSKACSDTCQKIYYGLDNRADVFASNWHMDDKGTALELQSPWGQQPLQLKTLGRFNLYNALAVLTTLMSSGHYSFEEVMAMMPNLASAPGRMEIVNYSPLIIVDYAHTPDALAQVLSTAKAICKGQLWAVFGCGGNRDKSKRPLMGQVASDYADKVIVTSDNPRFEEPMTIIEEVAASVDPSKLASLTEDRKMAILQAIEQSSRNDIILIAGKGHEDYQEIKGERRHFSDQETVLSLLAPA